MATSWMLRWLGMILISLLVWMRPEPAVVTRRWLADPELLTIDGQGRQYPNEIVDLALVNSTTGWAITRHDILRFDGRYLHNDQARSANSFPAAIDMAGPTSGWVVGTTTLDAYDRALGPTKVAMLRYAGSGYWQDASSVIHKDGSIGPLHGELIDVVARADGSAWAAGFWREDQSEKHREHPIVLHFDGTNWRDVTPESWHNGRLESISMAGHTDVWVGGHLGIPNGQGVDAARPLIAHLQPGTWTESPLPVHLLPPGSDIAAPPDVVQHIIMRDAGEGWAVVGFGSASCAQTLLWHYSGGRWADASSIIPVQQYISWFGLIPGSGRGWLSLRPACASPWPGQRMHFDNGTITPDKNGATLLPSVYALLSDDAEWAAVGGSLMRYTSEALPTERQPEGRSNGRYFATTGQYVSGPFLPYYKSHGLDLGDPGISDRESLALFGYSLSTPFQEVSPETGNLLLVQYFERARMEYHPENPDPYKVLLGRLGYHFDTGHRVGQTDCEHFSETGYELCAPFRAFWHNNGALPVFGFPVTSAQNETSHTDGRDYETQWFERERLEYHPEKAGTPYTVLLGLLGSESLRARGYLPAH